MNTALKKGEKTVIIVRKHWFILAAPIIWTLILLIAAIGGAESGAVNIFLFGAGVTVLWLIYRIVDRSNNLWAVTNLRVIDEKGVFSINSKETPLSKINNVSYRQPFLGRIFGYGNVQIQSAAESGSSFHKMVENPKKLKDAITNSQEKYNLDQIREQARSLADAVGSNNNQLNKNDISDELTKLHALKEKGIITEEDFQKRKEKILSS